MNVKMYKAHLKHGSTVIELFETPTDIIKKFGAGNIAKIEEVFLKKAQEDKSTSKSALEISARSMEDLEISKDCGYAVTYNKPAINKIYEGMPYLETSSEYVLVGDFIRLEKYDKIIHHHWVGPGYRPEKTWKWALYHRNARIVPREEVEKVYGKLSGVQGGIGYIKLNK